MRDRHLLSIATLGALALGFVHGAANAQTLKLGETSAATSITPVNTFNTDLDSGGDFHWATGIVSGSVTRQFTPQFSAGLTLRYDFEDWKFGSPSAFGGQAPWKYLNAPNIAVDFSYAVQPDLLIGATPTVGWGYESGARSGNALIYGAIVSATKVFSPSLVLGAGAGIVHQIDEHWRVSNPFRAGPAGASVAGRLSIDAANGNGFAQDDYKTAPAIGITVAHQY